MSPARAGGRHPALRFQQTAADAGRWRAVGDRHSQHRGNHDGSGRARSVGCAARARPALGQLGKAAPRLHRQEERRESGRGDVSPRPWERLRLAVLLLGCRPEAQGPGA